MNTTMKSAIAACGFLAAVSAPLTEGADTSVYSSKNAFGEMSGSIENRFFLGARASENASQTNSGKHTSPGAIVYGANYDGNSCWFGVGGSTDTIEFAMQGSLPKQVTASGSVPVTWEDWCEGQPSFTETVLFDMDLSAMTDQAYTSWGTQHTEYGNIKVNYNYNNSEARAENNASSISSPAFGTVTPSDGLVGRSKSHSVQITR